MRATSVGWVVAVLALTIANGCSSGDDDDDDDDDGSSGRGGSAGSSAMSGGTGATAGTGQDLCGTASCPPGQFCVNGVACTPGCLTDGDCAEGQDCEDIDDVTHIGTCRDRPVKDCPGYLTKCEACGGGELCTQQVCDGLSDDCVNCVAEASCNDSGDCPCD